MSGGLSAILTYHSLDDSDSVISISPGIFCKQMESLALARLPVVPLDEAFRRPGTVAITFDDGFRNVLDHAVPVLQRNGWPATVFVVTEFCGRDNGWPTQPPAIPRLQLMSWDELAGLPSTIAVGAHTATHPDLSRISPAQCQAELSSSREAIERRLGRPAPWFAYPYGAPTAAVKKLASAEFELAVGTTLDYARISSAPFDLPRIDTYYLKSSASLDWLFSYSGQAYIAGRRAIRRLRRFASR